MPEERVQRGEGRSRVGGTPVASERRGGDGKPGGNLLASRLRVLLVTAGPRKAVPGRQTAVRDWEGGADLLGQGWLKARVIPPPQMRELREVVRYRHPNRSML